MQWNSNLDVDKLLDEFHQKMFKNSATYIKNFYDILEKQWMKKRKGEWFQGLGAKHNTFIKEGETPDLSVPWFVWKDEEAKNVLPEISENFSHSGKNSAVLSGETKSAFLQIIPVQPQEKYFLTCYAYTNTLGKKERFPEFEIEWRKEDTSPMDKHYYALSKLKIAKSWEKLQFITTVPEGAAYGIILLMINNESPNQKVWFDDVFVGKIE